MDNSKLTQPCKDGALLRFSKMATAKQRVQPESFSVSYLPPHREGGFTLEAAVARCDITPLELETLLALWIVIYCCFILHQMNS